MVQSNVEFDRRPKEEPNALITNFFLVCDTFEIKEASEDVIRLYYSHSL